MKRFLKTMALSSLMLALVLVVVACGGSEEPVTSETSNGLTTTVSSKGETPQEQFRLTYNNFFSPTDVNSVLAEWWAKEIERRTNGGIRIDYVPGASLSTADKVYESVRSGMAEVGMSVLSYTMGKFPSLEIIDYPLGHVDSWVTSMVMNDFYNEFKPPEFQDVHLLYLHANNLGHLHLAEKRVEKLEDMKGIVVRSTGIGAKVATALGGSGYAAPIGEAYELMTKKVVGGSISHCVTLVSWNHAEVTKYSLELGPAVAATGMFVAMNKSAWERLPEEYQKVITEVSAMMPDLHGKGWRYYDKTAIEHLLSLPGREVLKIAAGDESRWAEAVKPVNEAYMTEKKAMGLPVDEYLAYFKERTAYWASKTPSLEEVVEWYESDIAPLVK